MKADLRVREEIGLVEKPGRDALEQRRQPKVDDLHLAVRRDEDVAGLEVSVNEPLAMSLGECVGNLVAVLGHLVRRERPPLEEPAQGPPSTYSMTIKSRSPSRPNS